MECDCEFFKKNIKIIDGFIELGFVHGIKYTGKPFIHCPWCGKKLEDKFFIKAIEEQLIEMGDIKSGV